MSEAHEHPHPNYMMVFYILFAATIAEVGVTYIDMSQGMLITLLLAMAFFKAILVALYFMHLKYDNVLLSVIAGVPLVLAAIALGVISYEVMNDVSIAQDKQPAPLNVQH